MIGAGMTRLPATHATDTTDTKAGGPLPYPRDASLFVVWGPPSHGPRSRVFARALSMDVEFVHGTSRRGLLAAPVKYGYQTLATVLLLARRRPGLVFVQSPPSLAVLIVALYGLISHARYIVDAHSDAMLSPWWTRPRWLHRLLARTALATVVTNEHFADTLRACGARALVLRDIPASFAGGGASPAGGAGFDVVVVNTFASDEPLAEVLAAAAALDGVAFHVTGDTRRAKRGALDGAPANVRFTGFLPDEDYYALLRASDAVMCLTTRDHTMQRGACEALSLGKPVITSDWPLLRDYFHRGTVHVDNTAGGIRAGVERMRSEHDRYGREITALRSEQWREWEAVLESLAALVGALEVSPTAGSRRGT